MGDETWVEGWQGGGDACGAPVAPHDGSNPATFTDNGGSVTIVGKGAYLGLAKAHNTGEDGMPADDTITYDYTVSEDGNTVEFTVNFGGGVWYYRMVKAGTVEPAKTIVGTWKMAPEAGSLGVGPNLGDYSWWSIDDAGVTDRACYYDDEYIFNEDGSFQNVMGDETCAKFRFFAENRDTFCSQLFH